jgi:hypothetical protein
MPKTNSGGFIEIAAIMIIALAVGGGAAYYFFTQVQNLESTPKPGTTEITQEVPAVENPDVEETEVRQEDVDTAVLAAVGDYVGSGRATRVFSGGEFTHTVAAILDDPAEGKFYEGWLVTRTPQFDFISTGKLTKSGTNYTLEFRIDQDYGNYNEVVITEETEANGLDGVPEDHVLEGAY